MKFYSPLLTGLILPLFLSTSTAEEEKLSYEEEGLRYHAAPAISIDSLKLPSDLPAWRVLLIEEALKVRAETTWPRYVFGSADPEKGGFDCSGAFYYVLRRAGYEPPRTSASQYLWLLEQDTLHKVSAAATTLDHTEYAALTPGDLVFWSGTYEHTDGRSVPVSHVGMYLGYMEDYQKPLMICASKGRSFKGLRRDGYGVYDFKIPSASSSAKIVGYGSVIQAVSKD